MIEVAVSCEGLSMRHGILGAFVRHEQVTLYSAGFATPPAVDVQDNQLQEEVVQARTVFWPTPLTSL